MITKADVEHVANLARLELTEEEKETYTQQLNQILDYAERLNQLDTSSVAPTAHVLPLKNVFREDKAEQVMTNEEALANAPAAEKGFFRVPKIV